MLTNPPFGADVEPSDVILDSDLAVTNEDLRRYIREFGNAYQDAQARVHSRQGEPIAALFELPKSVKSKVRTEILFLERCLALLKPGGRLGIVLPEGVLNNPSLAYVREFCEDRVFIRAVISLPQETFYSSGASVKASLVFMQKFTEEEQVRFNSEKERAHRETTAKYASEISDETSRLKAEISSAKQVRDAERRKAAQKELREYLKAMKEKITSEARARLKERFDYPISSTRPKRSASLVPARTTKTSCIPTRTSRLMSKKLLLISTMSFNSTLNVFSSEASRRRQLPRGLRCRV